MINKMFVLHMSGSLPSSKSIIGYRWVYAIKVCSDDQANQLMARFVTKEYTHIFELDYNDTFSLMV